MTSHAAIPDSVVQCKNSCDFAWRAQCYGSTIGGLRKELGVASDGADNTMLLHITPRYTMPHYLISYHIISDHIISYRIISYQIISYHIISYHIISYHIIIYHIISYHIISYHIISYHIISYHIISYHNISFHIIPYHTIPYHIISYHIISYHIISYHIMISYYPRTRRLDGLLPDMADKSSAPLGHEGDSFPLGFALCGLGFLANLSMEVFVPDAGISG